MPLKKSILFLVTMILPAVCMAIVRQPNIFFSSSVIDYINFGLVITSIISIRQYFWPGEHRRLLFHAFHAVVVVLFYIISMFYLISNKQYYEDYQHLSNMGCVVIFFVGMGIDSIKQWLIVFALIINILYIKKFTRAEI